MQSVLDGWLPAKQKIVRTQLQQMDEPAPLVEMRVQFMPGNQSHGPIMIPVVPIHPPDDPQMDAEQLSDCAVVRPKFSDAVHI